MQSLFEADQSCHTTSSITNIYNSNLLLHPFMYHFHSIPATFHSCLCTLLASHAIILRISCSHFITFPSKSNVREETGSDTFLHCHLFLILSKNPYQQHNQECRLTVQLSIGYLTSDNRQTCNHLSRELYLLEDHTGHKALIRGVVVELYDHHTSIPISVFYFRYPLLLVHSFNLLSWLRCSMTWSLSLVDL